jgi:uncharacterized repeat protein (TIGR03803 family)
MLEAMGPRKFQEIAVNTLRSRLVSLVCTRVAALVFSGLAVLGGTVGLHAQKDMQAHPDATSYAESVLYNFAGSEDGGNPQYGDLIQARDGNYYGATQYGGAHSQGSVFAISPGGSLTTVYSFCPQGGNCSDGYYPASGVIQGDDGNFYGTTQYGGANSDGTVFKLTPSGELTVLYNFCSQASCADGYSANGLMQGADGNFYGTTSNGGNASSEGVIFKVTTAGVYTVLHTFTGASTDGAYSYTSLLQGSDGNLYGITQSGGTTGEGIVYKITTAGTFTSLYSFSTNSPDVYYPQHQALIEGSDSNFYGMSQYGGANSAGGIYKLTTAGVESLLYSFGTNTGDGSSPYDGLFLASDGDFYGTTSSGGAHSDGTIFHATSAGVETVLYSFCAQGGCTDGSNPYSGMVQGSDGSFYGTAYTGGQNGNDGTVYELIASPALAAPVQMSFSTNSVAVSSPSTLTWKVSNAFSDTMQQCYAFIQGTAAGAGTWTGVQTGTLTAGVYTGSATITPTVAGTYTYALTCGGRESGFATLTAGNSDKLEVVTSSLDNGTPTQQYSQQLVATGGTPPYTWSISSGTLPGGLTLAASTGIISGVPNNGDLYTFTAEVKDSASNTATASLSINIFGNQPTSVATLVVSVAPTLIGKGSSPTFQVTATGSAGTPTGTVQFLSNGSALGAPVALNSGIATYSQSFTTAGSYTITAEYSGDATYVGANGSGGTLTVTSTALSYAESVLYNFTGNGNDGDPQYGALLQAKDGNYYGTTQYGGNHEGGSVFAVTPSGDITTIYSFCPQSGCPDGERPQSGLVQGTDGNLYGATQSGGTNSYGTIFKLTPTGSLTVLYNICSETTCADGSAPTGLVQGIDGNFYGVMTYGGASSYGVVFKITSSGTFTRLYSFKDDADGYYPSASLVQGSDGNLYGTTVDGGTHQYGAYFKISTSGTLTVLYDFCTLTNCADGGSVQSALVQGSDGNFYGTTTNQGANGHGTAFKITPAGVLTTLYAFCSDGGAACSDGANPYGGLMLASDGNFYGTTEADGVNAQGTFFQVTSAGAENTIYDFCAQTSCTDGSAPYVAPVQGSDGNFYGTTYQGGQDNNDGTAYEVTVTPALQAPVQLSFSTNSVAVNASSTLTWKVLNAFSDTMQQCSAFVQNNAPGAGTWTGVQAGTLTSGVYTGSATITPTVAGTYTYVLTCGGQESGFATLTAGTSTALQIVTTSLANGTYGQQYSQTLTATGGTPPYKWSLKSGALPTGITLNATTGELSGVPANPAAYTFAINAKDSATSPATASASYTVTIYNTEPTSTATLLIGAVPTLVPQNGTGELEAVVSGSSGTPTGTVQFYLNGAAAGSPATLSASGNVTLTLAFPTVGSYSVTGSYSGDGTYTPADGTGGTLTVAASGSTYAESVPYSFTGNGNADGQPQYGNLIQATDGNYYGTTVYANDYSGDVFKVTPAGVLSEVYAFCTLSGCADGERPNEGLTQGSDGNLYGTAQYGGANSSGTVFKLTPAGVLTTLYSFCAQASCADGSYPQSALVQGKDGNFYGTTTQGGTSSDGTVFKITSTGTFTRLYSFHGTSDGSGPQGGLMQGADGNLYGMANGGGANSEGSIFKITTSGTLTRLYSFCAKTSCTDGSYPGVETLVQGSDGNLYGTTTNGGSAQDGVAFKVSTTGTYTVLYSFCSTGGAACTDGMYPQSGVWLAGDGNFYGTTESDGLNGANAGTFFQLTYAGAESTLYDFCAQGSCVDGAQPEAAPIQGSDGNLYGTTYTGGASNAGTIYKMTATAALPAPVQISFSPASLTLNNSTTLTYNVLNAFSDTMQNCYAFARGGAAGAGTWTGAQTGALASNIYTGTATLKPTAIGTYTYVLNCGGVESGYGSLTVTADVTATTVAASPASIAYGNSASVTATVANNSATSVSATGTVSFTLGSTSLGSCTLSSGSCSLSVPSTSLALGANSIKASYPGVTGNYLASSGTTSVTVTQDTSVTSVTANPAGIFATASTSLTATIANSSSSVVPTGTVAFTLGATSLGSCTLSAASCSLTVQGSALALGANSITASYVGTADITASSETASVTVTADTTATAISATPTSITYSGSSSLKATVSNSSAPATAPTGTIAFTLGATSLGSCTLSAGTCSLTVQGSALALGANSITGTYTASPSSFLGSTGSASVTVTADTTTTTVSATPATVGESASTSLKATVTDSSSGSVTPSGAVNFTGGGTSLGSCTLSAGTCSLTVQASALAQGSNTITASYAGTTDFAASSGTAAVTVTADVTATAATATPATLSGSGSSSISATVSDTSSPKMTPTGTVNFTLGSTSLGSCTLSSGSCSLTVQASALATGANSITVSYAGATGFQGSSGSATVTVAADATATTVTANPATLFASSSTVVTASVSDTVTPASTPTGTVNFTLGSTSLGTCTLSSASCSITVNGTALSSGANSIKAGYAGVSNLFAASSGTASVTETTDVTATAITANPAGIFASASTSVTAAVSDTSVPASVPGGTVSFSLGSTTLGTCTLSAGSCSLTVDGSALSAGANSIKASYGGSASEFAASSGTAAVTVTTDVTATTLSANPASIDASASSTLTAAVNDSSVPASSPTGSVTFTVGSTTLGSCTLSSGTCFITASGSSLSIGADAVKATYAGATDFAASSGTASVTVTEDVTTTAISASPASIPATGSTSVTVTVSNTSAPSVAPTGTVSFTLGSASLGSCTLSAGSCSLTVNGSSLAIGSDSVTASYPGSASEFAASSGTASVTVTTDITTTAVSASPASIPATGSTSLTATVSNTSAPSVAPTGTVSFTVGSASLGSCTLSAGTCSLTVNGSSLAVGANSVTAGYAGATDFAVSSGVTTVTVTKLTATSVLVASPNPVMIGEPVTVKATVTGSGATPTGTVKFIYDGEVLATSALSGGEAMFAAQTNGLPPGYYSVTASYSGDANYSASISPAYKVVLDKAATTTTLTANPTTVTPPASVTLTATVKRSTSGSAGTPRGSVTFYVGTQSLATVDLNAAGVASLTAPTTGLPAGNYPVTAKYSGDSSDTVSASPAVTVKLK